MCHKEKLYLRFVFFFDLMMLDNVTFGGLNSRRNGFLDFLFCFPEISKEKW